MVADKKRLTPSFLGRSHRFVCGVFRVVASRVFCALRALLFVVSGLHCLALRLLPLRFALGVRGGRAVAVRPSRAEACRRPELSRGAAGPLLSLLTPPRPPLSDPLPCGQRLLSPSRTSPVPGGDASFVANCRLHDHDSFLPVPVCCALSPDVP